MKNSKFALLYPTRPDLAQLVQDLRQEKKSIVFTNGCFDLLHRGHATYLQLAKRLGDVLMVALNSDASVKKQNKGNLRPIMPLEDRAFLISQLKPVDVVLMFDEHTPESLLEFIKPDILVKGGDYTQKEHIVGYQIVEEYGGKVQLIAVDDSLKDYGTSAIINKIRTSSVH